MRNLLRFLVTYHFAITFVILESFAYYLVVHNNNYQQARFINFAQKISGYLSVKIDKLDQYLFLKKVNQQLVAENMNLRNQLERYKLEISNKQVEINDTLRHQKYSFIAAKVVNNSVNRQYNYITLNKGSGDGIKSEMAVISDNGVAGIVESVTEHFAMVISLLNRNLKVSAKIKKSNYFGSFEWSGTNYQKGYLKDIPLHVKLSEGDTIVTSGYSTIFPEGILIGFVSKVENKGGNFYDITLKISNDFKNLTYVYVVNNLRKTEQQSLESLIKHD
jgi:rod shape-determining protein MreC